MIEYWEEQENAESTREQKGQSQGRRRSRRISELCGIYEGGGNSDGQMTHPTGNGGGVEEGRDPDIKANSNEGINENENEYVIFQEPVPYSNLDVVPVTISSASVTSRKVNIGRK